MYKIWHFYLRRTVIIAHFFENADVDFTKVFTSRNAHAGIARLSCGPSAAVRFLHVSTPNFYLVFYVFWANFSVKNEVKNRPKSDKKNDTFLQGCFLLPPWGPLVPQKWTKRVHFEAFGLQKGSQRASLGPKGSPKISLWGLWTLKMVPKGSLWRFWGAKVSPKA